MYIEKILFDKQVPTSSEVGGKKFITVRKISNINGCYNAGIHIVTAGEWYWFTDSTSCWSTQICTPADGCFVYGSRDGKFGIHSLKTHIKTWIRSSKGGPVRRLVSTYTVHVHFKQYCGIAHTLLHVYLQSNYASIVSV